MSDRTENENENRILSSGSQGRRRSSIAELLASRPDLESSSTARSEAAKTSGSSMATALSQAQQQPNARRLSITSLGLSAAASQSQTRPFGGLRRGSSATDVVRTSIDENEDAIDDSDNTQLGDVGSPKGDISGRGNGSMSPLGRRFSFGARAYGDSRATNNNGPSTGGIPGTLMGASSPSKNSSPPGLKGKDGFSWSESLRTRAERGSLSGGTPIGTSSFPNSHNRSRSAASTGKPTTAPSAKPIPVAPDHFQERILKGDFYMD